MSAGPLKPDQPARPKRDTSAVGQAMEFRVWTELIQQSRGQLHVFLPLLDRGLDGVVHRLTDGAYIPIQVKSRSQTLEGMMEVVIRGDSLVDDRAVIVAGLLSDEGLGPTLLVVDEAIFKKLASHSGSEGVDVYSAAFSMHPTSITHWRPYLVPREELAARLLGDHPGAPGAEGFAGDYSAAPSDRHNQWLGFLGESEVIRRLAENSRLDLFRPFPDLEMVEVLARDNVTGGFAGLQVKAGVPGMYGEAKIHVQITTFVPAPTTWVVGLAWLADENRFAEECLLIPTEHLREVAVENGDHLVLDFHPDSPQRTPLDPYRQRLAGLGESVGAITSAG